jgi:hypothetical protein
MSAISTSICTHTDADIADTDITGGPDFVDIADHTCPKQR